MMDRKGGKKSRKCCDRTTQRVRGLGLSKPFNATTSQNQIGGEKGLGKAPQQEQQ